MKAILHLMANLIKILFSVRELQIGGSSALLSEADLKLGMQGAWGYRDCSTVR